MDELQITIQGDLATVIASLNIVASTVPRIRTELKALITRGAKNVVVDLVNAEMIDSTGIGLFISTHNSLVKTGGKITLTNVSEDLLDLFKALRLDQHFDVTGV